MDREGDDLECSEKFANTIHPHFLDFVDLDLPNATGFVMPVYLMDKDYLFAKYCNHSVVADFAKLLEEHRFNCSKYGFGTTFLNIHFSLNYNIYMFYNFNKILLPFFLLQLPENYLHQAIFTVNNTQWLIGH